MFETLNVTTSLKACLCVSFTDVVIQQGFKPCATLRYRAGGITFPVSGMWPSKWI
jgi:hypothetical protein